MKEVYVIEPNGASHRLTLDMNNQNVVSLVLLVGRSLPVYVGGPPGVGTLVSAVS